MHASQSLFFSSWLAVISPSSYITCGHSIVKEKHYLPLIRETETRKIITELDGVRVYNIIM